MNGFEELSLRCIARRAQKIGPLSDAAYQELCRAVKDDPANFIDTYAEDAFCTFVQALDEYHKSLDNDESTNEDTYKLAREKRLNKLVEGCDEALHIDKNCEDARLLKALIENSSPDLCLEELLSFYKQQTALDWENIWDRPQFRLRAVISRTCMDSARFNQALCFAKQTLGPNYFDPMGSLNTAVLALARLEQEDEFEQSVAHMNRETPWVHLGRMLLHYKLGRLSAAKRALMGYTDLYEAGALALLHPLYVEMYLPDRPEVKPGSLEECALAVREAEPIIADTPDFIDWCFGFGWFDDDAQNYADTHGIEW